jgi:hypothetical protein
VRHRARRAHEFPTRCHVVCGPYWT